jgi:hypothetical protein
MGSPAAKIQKPPPGATSPKPKAATAGDFAKTARVVPPTNTTA